MIAAHSPIETSAHPAGSSKTFLQFGTLLVCDARHRPTDGRRCLRRFVRHDWLHYETLAICRSLALARAAFEAAIAEKPAGMFMIRQRIRVVKRHAEGDW
jgi:hypothetical protein